jgi:hypothetical protein
MQMRDMCGFEWLVAAKPLCSHSIRATFALWASSHGERNFSAMTPYFNVSGWK